MLLRKYSIIMLVTFNSKGEYQLHMALGIVMVALHLHDSQRPFGHRHVNPTNAVLHRYEMGSLLTLLVMLWCGGFFSLNLCQTQNNWCEFMVVVVLVCNFLLVAVLMTLFVKSWCKRGHWDEKIIRMIESRRSAVSRRSGSLEVGQRNINGRSSHAVVAGELELKELAGEVKEKDKDMSVVKTGFINPMFSGPVQVAGMVHSAEEIGEVGEENGKAVTKEVVDEMDKCEILIDPATGRKYSWNSKTDETVWIDNEEGEEGMGVKVDDDSEILTDPVSGRRYVHHIPSGNTTWWDG